MSKFRSIFRPAFFKFRPKLFANCISTKNYRLIPPPKINHLPSLAFLAFLLSSNQDSLKTHFDAEKKISQLIQQAEECMLENRFDKAKEILNTALKLSDEHQAYGSLTYLCDIISSIVLSEGDLIEAENILVRFIEKLLQLGYSETDNIIVKFKLKLARLHQLLGSNQMAEYGFRDCISVLEQKMAKSKEFDEESNGIYMTALFWYGKLLADQKEYGRARNEYKKCLARIAKSTNILPAQKMVVLHNIGEVSAMLKDYDVALNYFFDAIEICLSEDPGNPDLPVYVVHVGLIFLQRKMYEGASYWCQTGLSLANHYGHKAAQSEGEQCIQELKKFISISPKSN